MVKREVPLGPGLEFSKEVAENQLTLPEEMEGINLTGCSSLHRPIELDRKASQESLPWHQVRSAKMGPLG